MQGFAAALAPRGRRRKGGMASIANGHTWSARFLRRAGDRFGGNCFLGRSSTWRLGKGTG